MIGEISVGQFRRHIKEVVKESHSTPDIKKWIDETVLPRFRSNFSRAVGEIHAALKGLENHASSALDTKILEIEEVSPSLGQVLRATELKLSAKP